MAQYKTAMTVWWFQCQTYVVYVRLGIQTYHTQSADENIWWSCIGVDHLSDEVGGHSNDGNKADGLEYADGLKRGSEGALWTSHSDD